jgi:P27 family predicted phage terminase small subunit
MARGRRPAVKLADPAPGGEGAPATGYVPDPPDDLTPEAAARWRRIVPLIAALCQLRDTDCDALGAYCEQAALRARALLEMRGQPLTLTTPNGTLQVHPLLKIVREADGMLLKLSERFGLTPADRKRLQLASAAGGRSALAEFLSSGSNRTPAPLDG